FHDLGPLDAEQIVEFLLQRPEALRAHVVLGARRQAARLCVLVVFLGVALLDEGLAHHALSLAATSRVTGTSRRVSISFGTTCQKLRTSRSQLTSNCCAHGEDVSRSCSITRLRNKVS